jgi:cobalt/nickel transport protein
MKRYQNLLMMIAVVVLVAAPLWTIQKPFRGTDDQATALISNIAPGYQPWFKPMQESSGGEINSLLFALQAALGSGFFGYYLGMSVTRAKIRRESGRET